MAKSNALSYTSLPTELKRLAKSSLGAGVLKSLFRYRYTYHIMVKADGDTFVSMVLYHYENEVKEGRKITVGVIDCVCVDPNYRSQGFGTLITFATIRKMSVSGAEQIETVMKLPQEDQPKKNWKPFSQKLDEHMRSLGFSLRGYSDNYYMKSSMKYRYSCIICDSLPDECRAAHYAITSDDELTEGDDE